MAFRQRLKTEHAGAREGRCCDPFGVKSLSRKVRRQRDKRESSVFSLAGEIFDSTGDVVTTLWIVDLLDEFLDS